MIHLTLVAGLSYLDNLAKDDMFAIKPRGLLGGDEELASVGVLAGVGHGQPAHAVVLQLEVLVGELLAVDGAAAGAWENICSMATL